MRRVATLSAIVLINIAPPQSGEAQSQLNPDHTFTIRDENGIRIAESTGGPKYLGEIFRYEQVLVLQEDPTRPETLIGRAVAASLLDEDGSIYIWDTSPVRIIRFSADGTYLNTIGRKGQGPGEYESPHLLSVIGNEVTISDLYRSRISIFRCDGSLIETIPLRALRRLRYAWPRPDGGFLLVPYSISKTIGNYRYESQMVTIISADLDTLATIEVGPVKGPYISTRGYSAWRVFNGSPNVAIHLERGIYTTTGIEPNITVHDFSGRVVQIIDAGILPEPVSRKERRTVAAALRAMSNEAPSEGWRARARVGLDHDVFCDPKAFWEDLVVDENGYLWAALPNSTYNFFNPERAGSNKGLFRVFSPEGEYLGTTKVPTRGSFSRGHFIALQENMETLGINVVLYRIEPAVTGFRFPE